MDTDLLLGGARHIRSEDLDAMDSDSLAVLKGELVDCERTESEFERRRRWYSTPPTANPARIYHREDPRWRAQYDAVRSLLQQRKKENRDPVWALVANVVRERPFGEGGKETRVGTQLFNGGAKVHIVDAYWGMCETVIAVGRHRGAGPWIRVATRVTHLENLRVKLAYHPDVIDSYLMVWGSRQQCPSEGEVLRWMKAFKAWQQPPEPGPALELPQIPEHLHSSLGNSPTAEQIYHVDVRLFDGRVVRKVSVVGTGFVSPIDFEPKDVDALAVSDWLSRWRWR